MTLPDFIPFTPISDLETVTVDPKKRGRISSDVLKKIQPRTRDLGKEVYEKAIKDRESQTVSALATDKDWIKNAKIIWNQERI